MVTNRDLLLCLGIGLIVDGHWITGTIFIIMAICAEEKKGP